MAASAKTANFKFPLYVPQDTFAPLTSFNQLSQGVDTQLAIVKTAADSAKAMSSANETDINTLQVDVLGLKQILQPFNSPTGYQFNPNPTGVTGAINYAFKMGPMFHWMMTSSGRPGDMQSAPFGEDRKLYTIASTPSKVFPQDSIPLQNAKLFGPVSIMTLPGGTDADTRYGNIYVWREGNITYFGVSLGNQYTVVTQNLNMTVWGSLSILVN